MADLADLGLRIRSEEVATGDQRLNAFAASAERAEKATDSLGAGSAKADGAIASLLASIDRTTREMLALQQAHQGAAQAISVQTGATAALKAELAQASTAGMNFRASWSGVQDGMGGMTGATKGWGQSLQQADGHVLAYRSHLASLPKVQEDVAKEAGAAAQAIGRLGQQAAGAATQAMGLGPIMSSFVEGLVPVVAAGGLFSAVATAIGLVAFAALEGEKDTNRFANAIQLTGNYAGITTTQYEGLVQTVEEGTDRGFGAARTTLLALISTGEFTRETIQYLSQDIINLADRTGQTTDQVTGQFAKMGDKVGDFAVRFNDNYHMLSLAQVEHIRLLEDQGNTTQAQLELSIAIHQRLGEIGPQNLGLLERAWRGVGSAISWSWEQLKGFGRDSGVEAQIARIDQALAANEKKIGVTPGFNEGLLAQRAALQAVLETNRAQSENTRIQQEGVEAAERMRTTWGSMGDNVGRARQEIARYRADIEAVRKANPNSTNIPSAARQAAAEADILKKYTPDATAAANRATSAAASAAAAAARRAESLAREMEAIRATTSANYDLAAAYGLSDEAAQRAAATADATGKAIKSRGDIDAFVSAQLELSASKQAVSGAKALADLTAQIDVRRSLNGQVSAGNITADEARQQMDLEARIRPILAAAAVVEGERKFALLEIVQKLTSAQAEKNLVDREAQLIADRQSQSDQLATLELERDLIGSTNVERARALAMLAKEIELRNRYGKAFINTSEGQSAIKGAGATAAMGEENSQIQTARNLALSEHLNLLRQIDEQARETGQGMADAFGIAGSAMSDLLTTMTGFKARQEEINQAQDAYVRSVGKAHVSDKQMAMFANERRNAEINAYGDMLSSAKGYFKEGSDGYRALQAAEQVYRAYQFAMAIQSMVINGQETAFTVGQNLIRSASHGVVAIARALASLPFPLNLAAGAATAAALAAIGVKLFGGGKSGGSSVSGSVTTAQGYSAQDANARTTAAQAIASQVNVVVTADRQGMNAYVKDTATGVATPMAVGAYQGAVSTSREAIPAEQTQKANMTLRAGRR